LSYAQTDYKWWEKIHHWDGHTSWVKYITTSPAFMGPNALPVPAIQQGTIKDELEVENSFDAYLSKGDHTQDWFGRLNIPVAKNRVSMEGYVVPLEHFKMDTVTRDIRAARDKSGEGWAGGDLYFSTQVQIVRNKDKWPDIAFELAFRTASGTKLRDARYTDAPGYFFDLSIGRSSICKTTIDSLRWYVMSGFYSFQTYNDLNLQNDAMLFGGGISLSEKKVSWRNEIGGYAGYYNNGDHPIVYRSCISIHAHRFRYELMYQKGIRDFPYTGIRATIVYHLGL
jgi:hypothetical protein